MFEKEAKEYATQDVFFDGVPEPVINHQRKEDFQKGAEFGYKLAHEEMDYLNKRWRSEAERKANEWHYVKDGDLPKETGLLMSKTLLLVTKMKGSACLSLALGQYNFSTQEFSSQHIVGLTDVISWKEIVLPELKESE